MSLLSSIFSKFKKVSGQPRPAILVNESIGEYEIVDWAAIQIRRSQINNPGLVEAILNVCKSNQEVQSGFLLDVRMGEDEKIKLIIAVSLDNERTQLDRVAVEFQDMFKAFPEEAKKAVIMSSASLKVELEGTELYVRSQV
jgi:hypothetical protein